MLHPVTIDRAGLRWALTPYGPTDLNPLSASIRASWGTDTTRYAPRE